MQCNKVLPEQKAEARFWVVNWGQVQQMEQYAAQTGNYSDYVEKINQLLELDSLHTEETATN